MKVIVCESAVCNPDGTYSVHRGGLDRFDEAQPPCDISIVLLVEMEQGEVGVGQRPFTLTISGAATAQASGHAIIPSVETPRIVIPTTLRVESVGVVTYVVTVGDVTGVARFSVGP